MHPEENIFLFRKEKLILTPDLNKILAIESQKIPMVLVGHLAF